MTTFAVVVHQEPEGGFWGEVPSLPGCYSQGEALEGLPLNLREAIELNVEVLAEEGRLPERDVQSLELAV